MKLVKFETDNWVAWEIVYNQLRILFVREEITLPTPGFSVILEKAIPQGINPSQLILRE
jgi:hypothetical protein